MKSRLIPLFLIPAFLIGCNTNWHSINRDKALEIANNIIRYNKHNKAEHLIKKTTLVNYQVSKGEKRIDNAQEMYAIYDLNQGRYQNTVITIDPAALARTRIRLSIYYIDSSSVINITIDKTLSSSGMGITSEIYPAANANEAQKIFENILDENINPIGALEVLDKTLEKIDYCNYKKEQLKDPSFYGSYEFLTKDNSSLSVKTNYSDQTVETESYVFEHNQCFSYERSSYKPNVRAPFSHYLTTYDYNTPVEFIDISEMLEDYIVS